MTNWTNKWVTCAQIVLAVALVLVVPSNVHAFQETTTIFLVRHAEAGEGDNPSLTEMGRARAAELVHVLDGVGLHAIHSTPLNRTLETAGPTAARYGFDIITTTPTRTFAEDMAHKLRTEHVGETVLVVSHSNTVPAIVNALGGGPFEQLPHTEYDALFVVNIRGDETRVFRMQYGKKTS